MDGTFHFVVRPLSGDSVFRLAKVDVRITVVRPYNAFFAALPGSIAFSRLSQDAESVPPQCRQRHRLDGPCFLRARCALLHASSC